MVDLREAASRGLSALADILVKSRLQPCLRDSAQNDCWLHDPISLAGSCSGMPDYRKMTYPTCRLRWEVFLSYQSTDPIKFDEETRSI